VLSLAVLAALGLVAAVPKRRRAVAAAAATLAILAESWAVPFPIDQRSVDYKRAGLAPLPAALGAPPPVYRFIAELPSSAGILELPLGEPAFDVRYMFYSTSHWRPLVNGYSGGAPPDYARIAEDLEDVAEHESRAWQTLVGTRAAYVVVHESDYAGGRGPALSSWLRRSGGREVAVFGTDRVFAVH